MRLEFPILRPRYSVLLLLEKNTVSLSQNFTQPTAPTPNSQNVRQKHLKNRMKIEKFLIPEVGKTGSKGVKSRDLRKAHLGHLVNVHN